VDEALSALTVRDARDGTLSDGFSAWQDRNAAFPVRMMV
jgi:hypothetical protein